MNKTQPTPYPELNEVLQIFVESVQEILSDIFIGVYLQGSFAVGDFDLHSDVDFIIVIEEDPSDDQVQALQKMHERIFTLESRWAQHLECSYFPRDILRDPSQRGKELWYLDNGHRSLERSDHCNTILVRWVIREKGVTLAGPPPETLVEPIFAEMLRADIYEAITKWGQIILDDPEPYKNRFYQCFLVLNFARMLHDLHTGANGSKRAGAEWAKANLEPSWSDLIDRAWHGRPNPSISVRQPADPQDFESTLKFIQVIIDETKLYAASM